MRIFCWASLTACFSVLPLKFDYVTQLSLADLMGYLYLNREPKANMSGVVGDTCTKRKKA